MLFALICTDKPDSLAIHMANRPAHLDFLKGLGDGLKAAVGEDGGMNGSLVIIEAGDLVAAKALAAQDPYATAGLFQSVDVRPWKWAIKNPEAA